MAKPRMTVRVTTETDKSRDLSNYLVQHNKFTDSQRVLAMKTMIMRGLSESRIADNNIPTILNNIPDDIYIGILDEYLELGAEKTQDDITLLANSIASQCGMYGIREINTILMVSIINRIIK